MDKKSKCKSQTLGEKTERFHDIGLAIISKR